MLGLLLTVHVLFAAITIGVLFVESLGMVLALRLAEEAHREGARLLHLRLHRAVYYPVLTVAIVSGFLLAWQQGVLSAGWLAWKLVLVVLLIGLGMMGGQALRRRSLVRPAALAVHILILLIAAGIVALAALKPL
jgi:uncharacterized membrane protein SirB2